MATPKPQDWTNFWNKSQAKKIISPGWSKKRIISVIDPYLVSGKKILDAGCGSGFFSKYFCDKNLAVTALDFSDGALRMAKEITQGRAKVIKADLTSGTVTQSLNEKFDIIFSDGLLEHFVDDAQDKIMKNFSALLNHDGVLVTFVPNRFSPWEIIRPFFMPGIDETPFVLSGLVRVNTRNDFAILKTGGINTLPFAFSPDKVFGRAFGMLLFTISKKK